MQSRLLTQLETREGSANSGASAKRGGSGSGSGSGSGLNLQTQRASRNSEPAVVREQQLHIGTDADARKAPVAPEWQNLRVTSINDDRR